ncbi:tyrosine-type recombinase/integrase [Nitrobacter sp.]|uniref:tyrosine-type recombinase/integrase n=1 Tax=Nitrobacter sp. TaxID=29420 RepID=UPI0029CAC0ED|nr:tyrosine-type recombinase/integrase [Nitrobacter sp.]
MKIKLAGVKGYRNGYGKPFYYLRASGERIVDATTREPIDPEVEPERFAARVQAMKEQLAALPVVKAKAGTLLGLIEEWRGIPGTDGRSRRDPSPEWQALSPATRKSYERMIDPERGYLRRGLGMTLDRLLLQAITTPIVVKIRNKIAKKFGFWTGNYAVKVLSTMFEFGRLYGHVEVNPARGVPALDRPEDLEQQHRPWADSEFKAMLAGARHRGWNGIMLALGLGRYAGWPTGDIVHQPPSVWQRPRLIYIRRKTRKRRRVTNVLAPDALLAIFDEVDPDLEAVTLVSNEAGEPYTEDGLRTMINRLCRELAEEGKVKPGLNIHGLRHSLGTELYDLGVEKEARKQMMAHESDAASKVYERGGSRSIQADKAVRALNRKHKRAVKSAG